MMLANRREYRDWLRVGVHLFDIPESVLQPGELVSYMHLADLEAACDLLGLDRRGVEPPSRRVSRSPDLGGAL